MNGTHFTSFRKDAERKQVGDLRAPITFPDGRTYRVENFCVQKSKNKNAVAVLELVSETGDCYEFRLVVQRDCELFPPGKPGFEMMLLYLRQRARRYLQSQRKARALSLLDYPIVYEVGEKVIAPPPPQTQIKEIEAMPELF